MHALSELQGLSRTYCKHDKPDSSLVSKLAINNDLVVDKVTRPHLCGWLALNKIYPLKQAAHSGCNNSGFTFNGGIYV